MKKRRARRSTAFVEQMARVAWREYPGHFGGALSKALVDLENSGSARVDAEVRPPSTGTWQLPPTPFKEPQFGKPWVA